MKLTLEKIEEYDPCEGQYELVKAHFPNGVPLTAASVRKCRRLGIDWTWAEGMLSPEARKAYEEAVATAWKAYEEATATALLEGLKKSL